MAGIDGGGGGRKRSTNSEINMIPFIDLLMVTIAFLLITAVWVTNSRIATNAELPGQTGCGDDCKPQGTTLHVTVSDADFKLEWRDQRTVVSQTTIPKNPLDVGPPGQTAVRYPDLATTIRSEWEARGAHRDPSDRAFDTAVLHTSNATPFREIVAVLDAINATRRDHKRPDGSTEKTAAFNATFSAHEAR
jgi:hypothetical protein